MSSVLEKLPVMEAVKEGGLALMDEVDAEEVVGPKGRKVPRTHRTVLTYRDDDNTKASTLRLFIREGEVMNPDEEAKIVKGIDEGTHSAVKLRQTGEAVRDLSVGGGV